MTINSDYIEVKFIHSPELVDILPALLEQIGFDSFLEEETGVKGYIEKTLYSEQTLLDFLAAIEITADVTFKTKELEKKNWNEEWEKNFDPVFIDDQVVIKAPFHTGVPDYPITILIEPKMSFGTGHHETTSLMIKHLLSLDVKEQAIADIGCGTGVLGIAARKLGASEIDGCDIDQWPYENSEENRQLNKVDQISFFLGDVTKIIALNKTYDVVLANINKNILLGDMTAYGDITKQGGLLLLSGFYESDCGDIISSANQVGFKLKSTLSKNSWASLMMEKR